MANPIPIHPLRAWRNGRAYSLEHVSALIEARGHAFKPRTVLAVEDGWRHPAYDVCEAIQSVTEDEVTVAQLRHWPLREIKKSRRSKPKRAA